MKSVYTLIDADTARITFKNGISILISPCDLDTFYQEDYRYNPVSKGITAKNGANFVKEIMGHELTPYLTGARNDFRRSSIVMVTRGEAMRRTNQRRGQETPITLSTESIWPGRATLEDLDLNSSGLILGMIEQAMQDISNPVKANEWHPKDRVSAISFLFDDSYFIDWGGASVNLAELVREVLGMDIIWVRHRILQILKDTRSPHLELRSMFRNIEMNFFDEFGYFPKEHKGNLIMERVGQDEWTVQELLNYQALVCRSQLMFFKPKCFEVVVGEQIITLKRIK